MRYDRSGFTLVEMMVALVLVVAVGAVTYTLLAQTQRVSHSQLEHAGLQDNVRGGALIVAAELKEIGYDSIPPSAGLGGATSVSPDLQVALPGRIEYKAMRGIGFTCVAPAGGDLWLRRSTLLGLRQPQVEDSVTMYVEGNPATAVDDAWIHAGIRSVADGTCADGSPALGLSLAFSNAVAAAAPSRMTSGGPVRFFEVMELRYYRSGGKSWLGSRSVSAGGVIEPMLGPLADSSAGGRGFTFAYLDRNGAGTLAANDVREISWTLRGVTDGAVRSASSTAVDSLTLSTSVALRNTLR